MDLQFINLLYTLLLTVVTTGTPILIGFLVVFIKSHLSAKQLQTAKSLATNGVIFAQQVNKDLNLNNEEKFNSALESAKELAKKYGVNLSDSQWKNLLEPAYNEVKKGLNELGDTTITTTTTTIPTDSTFNIPALPPISDTGNGSVGNTIVNNTLSVPDIMMRNIYDQVLAKATKDAEEAVKLVLENVKKSITPIE